MRRECTDLISVGTGAYHLEGEFLKDDSFYNIKVEITAINSKPPANQISDELTLKTVT